MHFCAVVDVVFVGADQTMEWTSAQAGQTAGRNVSVFVCVSVHRNEWGTRSEGTMRTNSRQERD